ncbi:unnamed protein product [Cuscuta europaea]|uniref:Uncharacterized protein n=1 Tax=Cuscuta europaea TaxID=41803 RepID=A0A9P0Z178_CUSEU|nr:unnamed protein product [Cuscuta europaea]
MWRLFDDVPSSHKGWKDRFCYVRMKETPFPGELQNYFKRHPKVEGAALEKDGRKISAIPMGRNKYVSIKELTLNDDLHNLGFRRYLFLGERDEKYPICDRVFEGLGGVTMNVKGFTGVKKKAAKDPKENPVGAFFKKAEGPLMPPTADAAAAAAKRKAAGKDVAPVGKKSKKGDARRNDPPVLIIDEHSASDTPAMVATAPAHPPSAQQDEGDLPRKDIQFSLIKGTAIVHGTVVPKEFLRGATPSLDKAALSRLEDDALDNKIFRSSLTACIALGEQVQRAE